MSNATSVITSEAFMAEHLPCYGRLFPSVQSPQPGKEREGAVFRYVCEQPGTVWRAPAVTVDVAAWDRCVACPEFNKCRDLSTAKMMLEMALNQC